MGIEHVSPDTNTNKILEIIERDAAVVIDNVLSSKDLDDIKNELKPYLQNDILREIMNLLDFKPKELELLWQDLPSVVS